MSDGGQPRKIGALAAVFVLVTAGTVGIATADGPVVGPDATFEAGNSGPAVTITEELELDNTLYYPDGETVTLSGHATFSSSGATAVTVENIGGDWTNLTTTDVSPGLTVDPSDKQAVTIGSTGMASFNFSSVEVENNDDPDLVYDASQSVTVTVTDLPVDTDIEAVDAATGTELADGTTDGTGAVTLTFDAGDRAVILSEPSGGGGGSGGGSSDDTPTPTPTATATPAPTGTPVGPGGSTETPADGNETTDSSETSSGPSSGATGGSATPTETERPTPTDETRPSSRSTGTTEPPAANTATTAGSGPGFGPGMALVGVVLTVGLVVRRR